MTTINDTKTEFDKVYHIMPRTWLRTIGDCSCRATVARACHSLPASVTSAPLLTVFKRQLKAFLFNNSFFVVIYFNYVQCPRSYSAHATL